MNSSVIEIIGLLIQKILKDQEPFMEEEKIIQELIDEGYDIKDIDEAFELIYNGTEIIEAEKIESEDMETGGSYNRIFTVAEKLYLPINIQGLIRRLVGMKLLTPGENEELISKMIQNSFSGYTAPSDVWSLLEEIVADERKLELISSEIPEFKKLTFNDFKYVN